MNQLKSTAAGAVSKVPAVTLGFWIIKILATTLGETAGDTVSMTMDLGYLVGTAIFFSILVALVMAQTLARKFHPWLYWATIIASTTAGTTMADFADRSLGIGYPGGSLLLLACVLASLAVWYWSQGSVSVNSVNTPKVEVFYWSTITFSQTLGTALGDWAADSGLGYDGGALVFGAALALVVAACPSSEHLAQISAWISGGPASSVGLRLCGAGAVKQASLVKHAVIVRFVPGKYGTRHQRFLSNRFGFLWLPGSIPPPVFHGRIGSAELPFRHDRARYLLWPRSVVRGPLRSYWTGCCG